MTFAAYAVDFADSPLSPSRLSGTWIVAQVTSQHEKRVAAMLATCAIGYYLPTWKRTRRYEHRVREQDVPLFQGYLPVCVNTDADWYNLRRSDSVYGIIEVNNQGKFIRELAAVHVAAEQGEIRPYILPVKGQRCQVVKGPMRGTIGKLVDTSDVRRFVMTVEPLGAMECHVPPEFLEVIEDNGAV